MGSEDKRDFNAVIENMIKSTVAIEAEQASLVLLDSGYRLTIQLDKEDKEEE